MKSRTAMHVGAAALVVGMAVSSAFAIQDTRALMNSTRASVFKCDYSLKSKGGGGGKLQCDFGGQAGFFAEGTNLEGMLYVPVGDSFVGRDVFLFIPSGKGSKISERVATAKLNTAKDDEGDAMFALQQFGEILAWVNTAARGDLIEPMKKAKPFVSIDDGFIFSSGKFASKAKVSSDFSTYNGSFKATLKGEGVDGKKITAKFKLIYKSAERAY